MAKVQKLSSFSVAIISIMIFLVGFCGGFVVYGYKTLPESDIVPSSLSFHFLELGNQYAGDCILIKNGDTEILVDGGSTIDSLGTILNYVQPLIQDDLIEYAIITHAHKDHIACFAGEDGHSLFSELDFGTIIDFPQTDLTTDMYYDYKEQRDLEVTEKNAKHYTALECYKNENGGSRTYDLGQDVQLEILYQDYYEKKSSTENNYSVCFQINQNGKHFLFTGDLEEVGEKTLRGLSQVELYKAGHHGSSTSSNKDFLNIIKPKICVVTCVAGYPEYSTGNGTFPTQNFLNRISVHTSNVFVTSQGYKDADNHPVFSSLNGNIVVISENDEVKVKCSASTLPLYQQQWFKNNRAMPTAWADLII